MNQTTKIPQWKEAMVRELEEHLAGSEHLFLAGFEKMDVLASQTLRRKLREVSARYFIVKQTLCRKTLARLGHDALAEYLEGPCGFAFGGDDPITVSKILKEFAETYPQFTIRGGFVENKTLDKDSVNAIASLPAPEVIKSQVLGAMLSPISSAVYVLNGIITKFAIALTEIAKKQEETPSS